MSREPGGATAACAMTVTFFGSLGAAAGGILWLCGQPWHRPLVFGGIGAMLGFLVMLVAICLGGGSDNA
jgi:hypothetical protein